ncbi:queuosine precursor transporter [Candidatus Dependentiae bacterium]|nr:queuosine precursor transporter [Candidatus Dependentiae bacterium]
MNELIFFLQIIFIIISTLLFLRINKSALVALVALQAVLANLFVIKQIKIFGFNATCADTFIVGSILGLNLLQEYYGKNFSKKALYISFFSMIFYLLMSQMHILYIPAVFDNSQAFFKGIFKFAPRIIISSIAVYFIALLFNNKFYEYLRYKFDSKYLFLRNFISIVFTQLLDTILFVFTALYGIVGSVWQVMFVSFALKLLVIFLAIPFIGLYKKFLKRKIIDNGKDI